MSARNIEVHDYPKPFTSGTKSAIQTFIASELRSLEIQKVDVYNVGGERQEYNAGNEQRLVIYINATQQNDKEDETIGSPIELFGQTWGVGSFLAPHGGDEFVAITSGDITVAEYNKDRNELNVLFDIFRTATAENNTIFMHILRQFEELVWLPKTFENSWVHTQDKNALTSRLVGVMREAKERNILADKNALQDIERSIRDYTQELKSLHERAVSKRRFVVSETEALDKVGDGLVKDLDLIVAHEKVKDLSIKDGKFIVSTEPLIIHADNGKHYQGGEFRIEIKPENTDIKFYGNSGQAVHGYWSRRDAHPHVNGETGNGCLGNAAPMIAELCAQMQIYPLVLVAIDYLEAANTNDPAGRAVIRWQEVDVNGNEIEGTKVECPCCKRKYDEEWWDEESYHVYETINIAYDADGDYEVTGREDGASVCPNCRDEHYEYSDEADDYAHTINREAVEREA